MTTVAELAARDHRDVGFVLFVEGWDFAYTDRAELAGEGATAWIAGDFPQLRRPILEGLTVPETITFSTCLENGMLESDDGATFTIRDFDRRLIALLDATNVGTLLGETLGPKDDPAPATLLNNTGFNDVDVWGKWINHEALGPDGQRRYYPCMPITTAGCDHAAWSSTAQTLAPSIIRDTPTWYEGQRCALYMIFRDPETGLFPSWQDHHESGESLVWYGTTTELTAEGLEWQLTCEGPSSWLRRQLGQNRSDTWLPVASTLALATEDGNAQNYAAYSFSYRSSAPDFEQGGSSYYHALDALPTSGTGADFRAAIQARLNTVAGTAGPDTTWTTSRNATCTFLQGRIAMQVADQQYGAYAQIALHERCWRVLGFDCKAQAGSVPDGDPYRIDFIKVDDLGFELAPFAAAPGPGYYFGRFSTIPLQYNDLFTAGTFADNEGQPRNWRAIHDEDPITLYPEGDQEIRVGLGGGSIPYLEGQLCRAPSEHAMANSGGDVDAMGFIALRGSYKIRDDAEATTLAALARVGWADDDSFGGHGPSVDADGVVSLWISDYVDARFVGIDRVFDGPWTSLDLEWAPCNYLGYNLESGDRADLVLLRTMLSSGTSSWSGYDGQGAVQTLGVNAHPDADAPQGSDVEIADLGLCIPADLIDAASFVRTANLLPNGGKNSPINRVKVAHIGSFDSQDFIFKMVEPRGWGMGFVRGQFRLFSRPQLLGIDDVEVELGPDDFGVDDLGVEQQIQFVESADLRPITPRDGFEISYGEPLVEGTGSGREHVAKVRAGDPQSRSRRSNNVDSIDGQGLIPTELWGGDVSAPPSWVPTWLQLAGREMATWCAQPHVVVDVPVRWSKARQLGPGSVVSFSSLYAPNREGSYGLSNRIGRVISTTINLEKLSAEVRVLVQPGDPNTTRRFAPVAVVLDSVSTVEARYDAATRTFKCYADFWGHGEGTSDVAWFQEPAWSSAGGDTMARLWQWDGRTWSNTASFYVESVDTSAHTITATPLGLVGTWKEAQPTIITLASYDDQDGGAWSRSVFSVVTSAAGLVGGSPGFPLIK